MNTQIIFFDGDGTLWYPRATKRTRKPFWIYTDEATKDAPLDHLELVPHALATLTQLRALGIKTVLLSTHPHEAAEAARVLKDKVDHFGVTHLFDEIHATAEYPAAKGEKILDVLTRHNLRKEDALMVGDSYRWDYAPVTEVGIQAVLLDSAYHQEAKDAEPVHRLINELDELIPLLRECTA